MEVRVPVVAVGGEVVWLPDDVVVVAAAARAVVACAVVEVEVRVSVVVTDDGIAVEAVVAV